MKSCSRWIAILAACFCFQAELQAQYDQTCPPGMEAPQAGPAQAELWSAMPGRVWVEYSTADQGLGYEGSYATIGAKTRLCDDFFDGRWLMEGQGHISTENGGFFSNIGIERVFSLSTAGADVVVGGWFDYDSDQVGSFAHTYSQFAVNGAIKTRNWDLVGNGYFPVGTTDFSQGDPTGLDCFFNNSIVLQAGVDSALQGFDAMVRCRPQALGMVNGAFELGGYAYGSDLVDDFGGVRARLGVQVLSGMTVVAEINHDNRFDITGVLQVGWQFGVNVRGSEYAGLGRDLEPTIRNDHIVRFFQDLVLAIDPDTGAPYNVFHVDNLADAAVGNGTVETPFAFLAEAEAASGLDDVIFVNEGDGTTRNYDNGIVLKDGQLLLGDGVQHLIPIQNGLIFELCNDQDGLRPRLSNDGGNVVTLADRNTVRGIIIEGNGLAINGISGNAFPAGPPITDGIIEDNIIRNAILNGILLDTIAGDWRFARNEITGNGNDGISIIRALDPTSTFTFEDNVVSSNGRDGIHMEDFDGTFFNFISNTTNLNGRDGVHLENYLNSAGTGAEIVFASPTSSFNTRHGIFLQDIDGDIEIFNPNIQGNGDTGIAMLNVTNSLFGDGTFIGTTTGGTSILNGNQTGVHIRLDTPGSVQIVTITDSIINNNGLIGILAEASGTGTELTTNVVNNISVNNTGGTGMRFTALQGALHTVLVENQAAPLVMNNNGGAAGNGIDFLVGDNSPGQISSLVGTVRNVNMNGSGSSAMLIDVEEDGQIDLFTQNVNMNNTGGNAIVTIVDTNANLALSSVLFDNVDISSVGADGINLNVADDSLLDFGFINGSIRDDYVPLTPAPEPNFHGFEADIDGAGTLVRILFQNNIIDSVTAGTPAFTNDGVQITTTGDSRTLATFDSNSILNNGPGSDPANLPYFDGIDIQVLDSSTFNLNLTNNILQGNFERSFELNNAGVGSVANIFMRGNTMDSDVGEDAPPAQTSALNDMTVTNGAAANTCLAMSNNFFQFGATVINLGAPVTFKLELDGLTNGVGQPTIIGAVLIVPFGSTCAPAIAAEEAFFEANGFPPQ